MAIKVTFVLFACFLGAASACLDSSDCGLDETCCSDYVCRVTCYSTSYCLTNYDCGSGECCDSDGDCYDCTITTGGIAGIVIGSLVIVIVASIVACCCCACCPYYRYRQPGTVIVQGTPYQPFGSTTTTQQTVHQQPPMGYNPAQPPPYYPQPQGGPYPPPQAQGLAPYPPPQAQGMYPPPQATTGQPIKQ